MALRCQKYAIEPAKRLRAAHFKWPGYYELLALEVQSSVLAIWSTPLQQARRLNAGDIIVIITKIHDRALC